MDPYDAASIPTDSQRKRRPKVGRSELFALFAELFYNQHASLEQLVCNLRLSSSTIKRMVSQLRRAGILQGRIRSLHLTFSSLAKQPLSACAAIVQVQLDIERLKELAKQKTSLPYRTEDELLAWFSNDLAQMKPYKGKIIVQIGFVVMGSSNFDILLVVHSVSSTDLFNFSRFGVERADGVKRCQTLMVASQ